MSPPYPVVRRRESRLSSGGDTNSRKQMLKYLDERRAVADAVFRPGGVRGGSGGGGGGGNGGGLLSKLDAGGNAMTWQMGMGPASSVIGAAGGIIDGGGGGGSGGDGSMEKLLMRVMADQVGGASLISFDPWIERRNRSNGSKKWIKFAFSSTC